MFSASLLFLAGGPSEAEECPLVSESYCGRGRGGRRQGSSSEVIFSTQQIPDVSKRHWPRKKEG